ncbi:MAG: hypothetical protein ACPGR8_01225 [Limisphaerales bacterium]
MQVLGYGAYGDVLTDGRLAYKFLRDDPDLMHYTRFFDALSKLSGTGLGDDMRPMLKQRGYFLPLEPCIAMPVYGPTLAKVPLQPVERPTFQRWLLEVVTHFQHAGVCHRDLSLSNVCRKPLTGTLVLIDMDSCFITDNGPKLKPEFGLYCPFFGYPAEVLPTSAYSKVHRPAVSIFTMWFSAQALFNIAILNDNEKMYLPDARPRSFCGSVAIFKRARRLANSILRNGIIEAAEAELQDKPLGSFHRACPAHWFFG